MVEAGKLYTDNDVRYYYITSIKDYNNTQEITHLFYNGSDFANLRQSLAYEFRDSNEPGAQNAREVDVTTFSKEKMHHMALTLLKTIFAGEYH